MAAANIQLVELEKIYRQTDNKFIELLNAIRNNSVSDRQLALLNSRVQKEEVSNNKFHIYLTTTNAEADAINTQKLSRVKKPLHSFTGVMTGQFDQKSLPTSTRLELKIGAQVMMLNNDSHDRWVNGSIGQVKAIRKEKFLDDEAGEIEMTLVEVRLNSGKTVEVEPYTWELFNFYFDQTARALKSETVGTFTQYPMKLAWAVTIHKSQGKTFDNVILDIGRGSFAHGQVYVALSRCTSFEGLILKKPILKRHIFMDWQVAKFLTQYQYQKSEKNCSLEEKIAILQNAIDNEQSLEITYLKSSDIKSKRIISPNQIGDMEYQGKTFLGLVAYCHTRQETRHFRIDRILEIKKVSS